MSDKEEPTMDQDLDMDQLLEEFDNKKEQVKEQREKENPDGRLSAYQLQAITEVVGGKKHPQTGQLQEKGLAHQSFPESDGFMTKLVRNHRKAANELEIIRGILPEYPEDLEKKMEDYQQQRMEIAKKNAGIPEDKEVEQVAVGQIKAEGNYEIFQSQVEELDQQFKDALDQAGAIDRRVEQILNKPLGKPDFDMIQERNVPASITGEKLDAIWPMITKG